MNLFERRALRWVRESRSPQKVLFGQEMDVAYNDAVVERQHGQADASPFLGLAPASNRSEARIEPVIAQDGLQPLGGTLARHGEHRPAAGFEELAQVARDRIEQVKGAIGPLGREVPGGAAAQVEDAIDSGSAGRRGCEDGELKAVSAIDRAGETLLIEVQEVGLQRAVRCGTEACGDDRQLTPRLVMFADEGCAGEDAVTGEMVERDLATGVDVIEHGGEVLVEQGQPVLHAREAATAPHGFKERVVGHGPETLEVTDLEALDRFRRKNGLAHGRQHEFAPLPERALGQGIKAPDRFQRRAEEVEPERQVGAGREHVDEATAHGVLACLDDLALPAVAVPLEMRDQTVAVGAPSGPGPEMAGFHRRRRRHPLEDGVGGGEHEDGSLPVVVSQRRQGPEPLAHDLRVGRHPIVGKAVPGREAEDGERWREKANEAFELHEARLVAGDEQHGRRFTAYQAAGDETRFQPITGIAEERPHRAVRHRCDDLFLSRRFPKVGR